MTTIAQYAQLAESIRSSIKIINDLIADDEYESALRAIFCDASANDAELHSDILSQLDCELPMLMPMIYAFRILDNNAHEFSFAREYLTEKCLSLSLCPLHYCDYAICFDDENAECASIRAIHPSHDT